MTSFNSVGDQSRSYQLRLSQHLLKSKLDRLTKEVATGIRSDIPLALNGDLSRISHVDTRITMLATYQQNASEAKTMFESMQRVLERIQSSTDSIGPNVLAEANTSPDDVLRMRASQISQDFRSVFSALNTNVGGRHLFSGNRTDTAPLGSFDDMISGLNAAVAGATTANDIVKPDSLNQRVARACCRASVTKGVCFEVDTRQPRIRRENTSTMNATYTNPVNVHTYEKSATHSWSGQVGVSQPRLTRSG